MYTSYKIYKIIALLLLLFIILSLLPISVFAEESKVISKVSTTSKLVALTFDDGSDGGNITKILEILAENEIKATFFLTGEAVESHPKQIKSIIDDGHLIGNHSYSHPYFTKLTSTQIKEELSATDALIKEITGKSTKPYFRPPYGDYNTSVLQVVGNAGYTKTIYWTIDTLDWKGISASEITDRVLSKVSPGSIVLMHAGAGAVNTPAALPGMIKELKDMGYQFVTISELLNNTPSTGTEYVVKAGDTLSKISQMYGVTVEQIVVANNITNPNLIYVNQVLIIPGKTNPDPTPVTTKYTVKAGDTLSKISQMYGVTVEQIVVANNITNPNLIYVNQVLIIPDKTKPDPTPVPTKYTVKAGDTLSKISQMYGVTVEQLVTANKISNPNLIYVNQVLIIPQ